MNKLFFYNIIRRTISSKNLATFKQNGLVARNKLHCTSKSYLYVLYEVTEHFSGLITITPKDLVTLPLCLKTKCLSCKQQISLYILEQSTFRYVRYVCIHTEHKDVYYILWYVVHIFMFCMK